MEDRAKKETNQSDPSCGEITERLLNRLGFGEIRNMLAHEITPRGAGAGTRPRKIKRFGY